MGLEAKVIILVGAFRLDGFESGTVVGSLCIA
jgi:hypothetical protein